MLCLHTLEELIYRNIPIHLVGLGNEQRRHRLFGVAHLGLESRVIHQCGNLHRVNHQLPTHLTSQPPHSTSTVDGDVHGCLIASPDTAEHMIDTFAVAYLVTPCADALRIVTVLAHPLESMKILHVAHLLHLDIHRVGSIVTININVGGLLGEELRRHEEIIESTTDDKSHQY